MSGEGKSKSVERVNERGIVCMFVCKSKVHTASVFVVEIHCGSLG